VDFTSSNTSEDYPIGTITYGQKAGSGSPVSRHAGLDGQTVTRGEVEIRNPVLTTAGKENERVSA